MRRRYLALILSTCLVPAMVACRSEDGIGEAASSVLAPHARAVRTAAQNGDRDTAAAELAQLRQAVAQLQTSGELGESEAAEVLQASLEVERGLTLLPAPTPPEDDGDGGPVATSGDEDDRDDREEKDDEDAGKRAEEAVKKAEEEAKKRAEDARKRAEDANEE